MMRYHTHQSTWLRPSVILLTLSGIAVFVSLAVGQQRRTTAPAKKEFTLRYTHQTRTEMAQAPIQMPVQRTTVYIKGKRQRTDEEQRQLATIHQCDLQRFVYLNLRNKTCLIQASESGEEPQPSPPAQPPAEREEKTPPAKPRKGGVVVIEGEITDTGERKEMFGLQARHILSRQVIDAQPGSCNPGRFEMTTDQWLVDLPRWTCVVKETPRTHVPTPMRPTRPDCQDTMRNLMKGNPALLEGFPLYSKQTFITEGHPISTIYEVTDLSLAELDPALFDLPSDCREMQDAQAFWAGVRSESQMSMADAMRAAARAEMGKEMEPKSVGPKRAGVLRIGVSLKDNSGATLDVPELRREMVDTIDVRGGDTVEAVPLMATASPELGTEAEAKQVDYILLVNLREAKPSVGRKLGGILGRAAGVEVKDKTSAKLDYQWIERVKMETLTNKSLKDEVNAPVVQAVEQFCRKSAEQALDELWRVRKR
jgi:hypothetical protein